MATAASTSTFAVTNPATGEVLARERATYGSDDRLEPKYTCLGI